METRVFVGYAAMILLWGSTWGAIKIGVGLVPAFTFAFERALVVAVILTAVALVLRKPFPRDRKVLVATAFAGAINIGLSWAVVFWSEQYVDSGLVAVFGATAPVWTAFLAHFLIRGDRLSLTKVGALALGLTGTAVLVGVPDTGDGPQVVIASILLALLPVFWGLSAVITSRYLTRASPVPVVALQVWVGALFLLPFALTEVGRPSMWSLPAVLAFGYLVIFGSCIGFVLHLWLFRKLRPTTIMLMQVLIPVEAVLIGAIALGEELSVRMLIGAVLAFAAVGLNARAGGGGPPRAAPTTTV